MAGNVTDVIELLLHGLNGEKSDILRPCLQQIKPELSSDLETVQAGVLDYFSANKGLIKALRIANFVRRQLEYLQKLPEKVISDLSSNGGVFIFIDDSNLWIGAKEAACDEHMHTKFDPRIRIDMGKLISAITKGRVLIKCKIYGSEPPYHDTFWKMYEALGAEVFTFPRSPITGGEKQVDTQISSDMVEVALEHSSSPFQVMIAVGTGDLDLLPPARIILAKTNFGIEVWSWKQSLSGKVLRHSTENKRMTVKYLDGLRADITFKELVLVHHKNYYSTIKFKLTVAKKLSIEELNTSIESITHWPVQYFSVNRTLRAGQVLEPGDTVKLVFLRINNTHFNSCGFQENITRIMPNIISCVEELIPPAVEQW